MTESKVMGEVLDFMCGSNGYISRR